MLRFLAWRLGFAFWNLIAVIISIAPDGWFDRINPTMKYFTFGANLDPAVLYRRWIRVRDQEEFLVQDYEMRFTQQGPFLGGGFASLEAAPGKVAYGRLLTLTRVDAIRMDYSELTTVFRRHRRVTESQDGKTFFFYQATDPVGGLIPTEEYKGKIMQAAEQSDLIPAELLEELRQTSVLEELQPALGTNLFIENMSSWPPALQPILAAYERFCFFVFRRAIRFSIFERLIRMEKSARNCCTTVIQ